MAWTPKDQDKLNRLKKESTILEQEQKKLMEDAAKLSGIAYQNAIKTIKAKGKQLTAMKGQKAILEGMVEDEEKIFKTTDKTRALEYDIAGSKAKLKKLEEDILKSTKAVGILTHKERKRLAQKMAIQKRNLDLMPFGTGTLMITAFFFLFLLSFMTLPFDLNNVPPIDG